MARLWALTVAAALCILGRCNGLASNNWRAAAASSDGRTILLGAGNSPVSQPLVVSRDGGYSFSQTGPSGLWSGTAVSADGRTLLACATNEYPQGSVNGGVSWTSFTRLPTQEWYDVALSSDGSVMVAVGWSTPIWTSPDGGESWSSSFTPIDGVATAVSANGSVIVALDHSSSARWALISRNRGRAFTNLFSIARQRAVAISADSSTIFIACNDGGQVWRSQNFGVSFQSIAAGTNIVSISISRDASLILYASSGGAAYLSSNNGSSWSAAVPGVSDLCTTAVSGDGRLAVLLQCSSAGSGYFSVDGGAVWTSGAVPTALPTPSPSPQPAASVTLTPTATRASSTSTPTPTASNRPSQSVWPSWSAMPAFTLSPSPTPTVQAAGAEVPSWCRVYTTSSARCSGGSVITSFSAVPAACAQRCCNDAQCNAFQVSGTACSLMTTTTKPAAVTGIDCAVVRKGATPALIFVCTAACLTVALPLAVWGCLSFLLTPRRRLTPKTKVMQLRRDVDAEYDVDDDGDSEEGDDAGGPPVMVTTVNPALGLELPGMRPLAQPPCNPAAETDAGMARVASAARAQFAPLTASPGSTTLVTTSSMSSRAIPEAGPVAPGGGAFPVGVRGMVFNPMASAYAVPIPTILMTGAGVVSGAPAGAATDTPAATSRRRRRGHRPSPAVRGCSLAALLCSFGCPLWTCIAWVWVVRQPHVDRKSLAFTRAACAIALASSLCVAILTVASTYGPIRIVPATLSDI